MGEKGRPGGRSADLLAWRLVRGAGWGETREREEEEWEREKELEEDEENGGTILMKKQRNRRGTREDHPRWSCS